VKSNIVHERFVQLVVWIPGPMTCMLSDTAIKAVYDNQNICLLEQILILLQCAIEEINFIFLGTLLCSMPSYLSLTWISRDG
jgi:hypothetical protein